jgi:ribA/ribD-fused uncharacterized protein
MNGIYGFQNEYRFLSNFWPCNIEYNGLTFNNSESLYMAHKSGDEADFVKFAGITKPGDAKRLGRTVRLQPGWDEMKFEVMEKCLRLKFDQNPGLKEKLVATGDLYLEETNQWKDVIWGVCNGVGENNLGKLLMKLREEYANK